MKIKTFFWIVAVIALVGGGVYWWPSINPRKEGLARNDRPVKVIRGDIRQTVESTGTIRPQNRLEIKPPIAGRIEKVLVSEGDRVKAGQTIAWMSSTDRAALLDAARAHGPEVLEHWEGIYRPTPIIAPLDGEIIARDIEPGQTVTASDTLLVMSDVLIVEAQVDETDLAQIAMGQRADVTLDAYPEHGFGAAVSHISYEAETVDSVTIYEVEALPKNMPVFVRSGMTAGVKFIVQVATNVLLLPAEAVQEDGFRRVVWMRHPENPREKRPHEVRIGIEDGQWCEICDGLAEGDEVLIARSESLALGKDKEEEKTNPFMPSPPRGEKAGGPPPGPPR